MYKVQVIAKKNKQQNKNQKTIIKKQQKKQTNGKIMYECGERWCIGSALWVYVARTRQKGT